MPSLLRILILAAAAAFPLRASEPVLPAGLALWLRADATAQSQGALIWTDQSGLGRDAIAASASTSPSIAQEAINGHPALRFDGVDDQLLINGGEPWPARDALTIFAVVKFDNLSARRGIIGAATEFDFAATGETGLRISRGENALVSPRVLTSCETHVLTAASDANGAAIFIDGEPAAAGPLQIAPNPNASPLTLGAQMSGEIAEIIVFDRVLTDAERDSVHTYLGFKYFPLRISGPRSVYVLDPQRTFVRVAIDAGSAVFQYQWGYAGGGDDLLPIADATSAEFRVNGYYWSLLRVRVSAAGELIYSSPAIYVGMLGDIADPVAKLVQRRPSNPSQLELIFNVDIDPFYGWWTDNYLLAGANVTRAEPVAANVVLLTTDGLAEDQSYELTIRAMRDQYGNFSGNRRYLLPAFRPSLVRSGRSTDAFTLSWTEISRRYSLEQSPSLIDPAWTTMANPIHTSGATNTVAICGGPEARYFRLRSPE